MRVPGSASRTGSDAAGQNTKRHDEAGQDGRQRARQNVQRQDVWQEEEKQEGQEEGRQNGQHERRQDGGQKESELKSGPGARAGLLSRSLAFCRGEKPRGRPELQVASQRGFE